MSGQVEESRERELRYPHSWGDLRTWLVIAIFVVGGIAHTFIIRAVVGQEVMGPSQWNLGYPPTAPSCLLPLLFVFG